MVYTDDDIIELLKKSDFSVIGFSFRNELKKDFLLSNFKIENIDFTFISSKRNYQINSLLYDMQTVYVYDTTSELADSSLSKAKIIAKKCHMLRESNKKCIVTSPMYRSPTGPVGSDYTENIMGGQQPLYIADLVVMIRDDGSYNLLKNRFAH